MTQTSQPRNGALADIRVIDLTRVLAGPYCTMLLGDYGADVIKIERPGSGDDTRRWGPPFAGEESVYFLTINRNKRSVGLDLDRTEGRQLLSALISTADVVAENFRPGLMERWGLGYEDLAKENPGLIYCSMSGYGNRGPRSSEPGYDAFVMAIGGLMDITGEREGAPVRPGVAVLDVATGLAAQGAISAALFARSQTGIGQRIDLSLLAMQLGMLVNTATNYLMAGMVAQRMGSEHPSIVPYRTFRASDGYLMIGAPNEQFWQRLCRALGRDDLLDDDRLATNELRVSHRDFVNELIAESLGGRTVEEWLSVFRANDVPAAPVNDVSQALNDPQVTELGLIGELDHPTAGTVRMVGPVVDFAGTPAAMHRAPPQLGQHTDEVLAESLGLSSARIAELRASGVIE